MRDALNKTGRPIFYSVCNWGEDGTERWGPSIANSWRTSADIANIWGSIEYNFIVADSNSFNNISSPGGWNDPDMLEVGNGGLSLEEEKTHFALWAVMKSPLIIGCDLATVSNQSLAILKNKEIIAVNQDPKSPQARCVQGCNWWNTLARRPTVHATTLSTGEVVIVVVNWRQISYSNFEVDLSQLGIELQPGQELTVRDLYQQNDIVKGS
jgi:alpha-galactosidase